MSNLAWIGLPERLTVPVTDGFVFDRPPTAELDATLDAYETRVGFRLPTSYREFLPLFGPGELAGYFRIGGPIAPRFYGQVSDAFNIESLLEMVNDPNGYWATEIAPTLSRRLVPFTERRSMRR